MIGVLFAVALMGAEYKPPESKVKRLAEYILRKQPKAKPYAELLARRIFVEGKRRNVPIRALAAIGYIESAYQRGYRGAAGEIGVFQLGANGGDHRIPQGWSEIRRLYPSWPVVKVHGNKPWAKIRQHGRDQIMDSVRAGTYLVALEPWSVRRTCRRMRSLPHRSGGKLWRPSNWYRHKGVDVFGHYQSGTGPPLARYLRALRHRAREVAQWMARQPRP